MTVDGQSGSAQCDALHNVFLSLRKWPFASGAPFSLTVAARKAMSV
jgi:hypothetical protein